MSHAHSRLSVNELITKAGLKQMIVVGKRYHSPLPPELERFYCYMKDGGHCILVLPPGSTEPFEEYIVPAPVKAVLKRGYTVKDGYVWCDIPYSAQLGLICDGDDDEFDEAADPGGYIVVENDGDLIASTNYWSSDFAKNGCCFFSANGGCIRLLLPERLSSPLGDDVLDGAHYVIVTRGRYQGCDGYEVLFEDGSAEPFVILTSAEQWDRLLPYSESGRTGIPFYVYRKAGLVRKLTARFRMVTRLPCLRPW